MAKAIKNLEIISGKSKTLFPEKLKDAFYYEAMILAKIMTDNEYAAPVRLRNPREIFREYAEQHFKSEPPELTEAQKRLQQAINEVVADAEKLGNAYRRFWAKQRAIKWHCRSWKRKGW